MMMNVLVAYCVSGGKLVFATSSDREKLFFYHECLKYANKPIESSLNSEYKSTGNSVQTRSFIIAGSPTNLRKFLLGYRRYGENDKCLNSITISRRRCGKASCSVYPLIFFITTLYAVHLVF